MERLTHYRMNGIKEGHWSPNKKQELVERLGQYEDTGLTPGEIVKLKERDTVKAPERAEEQPYFRKQSASEVLEDVRDDICNNYCEYRNTVYEDGLCDKTRDGGSCPLDRL